MGSQSIVGSKIDLTRFFPVTAGISSHRYMLYQGGKGGREGGRRGEVQINFMLVERFLIEKVA